MFGQIVLRNKQQLQTYVKDSKRQGKKIGFVPTMGALHAGHLSLVKIAKQHADIVVVSIFVNPAQFAAGEDFEKYPRTENSDLEILSNYAVDAVYMPRVAEIYPEGFSTKINVGSIGEVLEGEFRPGFFDGVALVVAKLFMQVLPDYAVFGEKDYQQLQVIKKLVRELDFPIAIIAAPIVREEDGLAMSSRNIYLNQIERSKAPSLYKILSWVKSEIISGANIGVAILAAKAKLLESGFLTVDYLGLYDSACLESVNQYREDARILAVARIGTVRLLDNLSLS